MKLTFNLSPEVYNALQSMSEDLDVSLTEMLRLTISHQYYFLNEVKKGNQVLLKKPDGSMRIVCL